MLRFFRVNDPYRLLAILIFLFLCSLPLLMDAPAITKQELRNMVLGESLNNGHRMYVQVYDATAPMAAGAFGIMNWIFGRSETGEDILALFILFFHAAFFAILLINNRAYNDNTYVPGLIYGLLCFVSFDFLSVSPELLGSTVLLLALNNLFREVEFRIQRDETVLNIGFFIGVASLFVFSYSVFLIAAFITLTIFTRLTLRKAVMLTFGFLLPHAFVFMFYFYWGQADSLLQNFYIPQFALERENFISLGSLLMIGALPLIYFVFSMFMLTREARFTKYQSQLFQVMFLWLIFSIIEIIFTREFSPHSFIAIIPSLTYFFSHYLLLIRRRWIAEMALWVLIVGILTINYLSRHGKMSSIDYSGMYLTKSLYGDQVKGKQVMVLGDDPSIYQSNQLGGYFLNWRLSESTVTGMDYYKNVDAIYDLFQQHPPDVIIDEKNLFPSLAGRIPSIAIQYRKEKNVYWRNKKD